MEMKKAAAAVLLLLVLLTSQVDEAKSDAFDCYDGCTTGCVASYINDGKSSCAAQPHPPTHKQLHPALGSPPSGDPVLGGPDGDPTVIRRM